MYAAVFAGRGYWRERVSLVRLDAAAPVYLHDEFVELRLRAGDPRLVEQWRQSAPRVVVTRDGTPVTTIAGIKEVVLAPRPDGSWTGRWPCPWNAPEGEYRVAFAQPPSEAVAKRLKAGSFRIGRRKPIPLPDGFSVLTLETARPFKTMRVRAPDGTLKDWRGLLDWVQYVGADAFWIMAGHTPGDKAGEVWLSHNLDAIPEMAAEAKRRGIKFGVYAMCYLTMSNERLPRYEYALDVKDGVPVATRAISIRDANRPKDVIELLKRFRDVPGVDYLGLDYIRNPLGGYELVDEFFAEMPGIKPPPEWGRLTRDERIVYLARKKIMRRDLAFVDAWQWWRAHRVARLVRGIRAELGDKPLWAFTLTWDKGWHHGQDPVMMNDAGIDADALMLYEADEAQFSMLLKDWNAYVKRDDAQLLVGDVIDWPLHQRSPEGPRAFTRRSMAAIDRIYSDGRAKGVFIHDLGRALWGRLGPWSSREWLDEARKVVAYAKARPGAVGR